MAEPNSGLPPHQQTQPVQLQGHPPVQPSVQSQTSLARLLSPPSPQLPPLTQQLPPLSPPTLTSLAASSLAEADPSADPSATAELDSRSVYVLNLSYNAGPDELERLFAPAGPIAKISILIHRRTGLPKGYAYIAFGDVESAARALTLQDLDLRGRLLKVYPKRTIAPRPRRGRGRGRSRQNADRSS